MSTFIESVAANNANVLECATSIAPIASHFVNKFLASHSDGDQSDFDAYVAAKVSARYFYFIDAEDDITREDFEAAVAYIIHESCDELLEIYRDEDEALNA